MDTIQPAEFESKTIIELLNLLNSKTDLHSTMKAVGLFLKDWSGCEAVGIRLRDDIDFPYYETLGFPDDFVLKEKFLCSKDLDGQLLLDALGNPMLECMCGNIICGRFDTSKSFFTQFGSFWSNSTTQLLATTTETDRQSRTRNRCNGEGYESVALIPLKTENETFGLIQLNDKRTNRFSIESISFLEHLCVSIALALSEKKALKALLENEERYRELYENSPLSYQSLDSNGRFLLINKAWVDTFGHSKDEVIGKWFGDFLAPEFVETFHERFSQFKAEGRIHSEFMMLKKDGARRFVVFDGRIGYDKFGVFKQVHCILQDITTQKEVELALKENEELLRTQNEALNDINTLVQLMNEELLKAKVKAEESDHLKSSFLANMSHEVRTPMNAIIGFTEFLTKPNLSDVKKNRFIGLIQQRTYDLMRIIEDILDVSKIEVGQMKIIESEESLSELLTEIYDYFLIKKEKLETRPALSIKLSLDDSLKDVKIKTDGPRLKQILNNLSDNAFKFTQQGVIELGCKLKSEDTLLFFVRDTGIGIPKDKQEIIFDRFRQAEDSFTTRKYGGTGLGLSIVKGLISLMKGDIWVESQMNVGTTFYFTIPFKKCSLPKNNLIENEGVKISGWRGKTVLIVEDDIYNVEYFQEVLQDANLKLLNAYNGKQALKIFEENPTIDLVLMDIRLPDINGLIVTKIIKATNPKMVVIAQTAYASSKDIQDCFEAGCNSYIVKPLNQEKLISLMDQYLNKKI